MKKVIYIILLNILTLIYAESNRLELSDIVERLMDSSYTASLSRNSTELSKIVYEEVLGLSKPLFSFKSDPYTTPLYSYNNYVSDIHTLSGELQLSSQLPTGGTLNLGLQESFTISKDMDDEWDTELEPSLNFTLYQPLFLNKKFIDLNYSENSRRGFEIDYEIALLNELETRNQIILGVLSSLHNLNRIKSNIELLNRRLEQLERNVITGREDRDLGRISAKDVLEIELRLANQKELLFDLEYNKEMTELSLKKLLGLENIGSYSFILTSTNNTEEESGRDIKRNINQQIAKLELEKSELTNGVYTPGSTPDLNMFFNTNYDLDISFGLGFNVDIYDRGAKKLKQQRDDLTTKMKRESYIEQTKESKNNISILEARIKLLEQKKNLLNRNINYDQILLESERDLLSLGSSTEDSVNTIVLDLLSKESDLKNLNSELTLIELELISLYGIDLYDYLNN